MSARSSTTRGLVALALGLLPPYALAIFARLSQGQGFTLTELVMYPLVAGTISLGAILALHRYVCLEPLSTLSPGAGSLMHDTGVGAALGAGLLAVTLAAQPALSRFVAPHRNPDALTLITGLLAHPALLLVWFGPVLWIGVALFEEVARVFCINRIVTVWKGPAGRLAAVAASSAVFGLMHYYQGPAGIISTGGVGLVLALYYIRFGRIWPLVVAHAVYDALSIGLALYSFSHGAS
jgi:membrane protease YdiL (CAAX protease family)